MGLQMIVYVMYGVHQSLPLTREVGRRTAAQRERNYPSVTLFA